jgi:serine/threonine protein kinase
MVGQVVGNYRLVAEIGRGAMGAVYRAMDVYLGRSAAVKLIASQYLDNREALRRFEREGRAASSLAHPNICTVFEIGHWRGQPYIAMELLEGQTLERRLAQGPLPPAQVLDTAMAVANALEAAHGIGIVHRDIKPGNVFLTTAGRTKVLDFGLAKVQRQEPAQPLGDAAATIATFATIPGAVVGTLAYMAPEQFRGEPVDGRADLYSLGVLMHESLTGALPLRGSATPALGAFGPIVARLIAPQPGARFVNAAALRQALAALAKSPPAAG